MENTSFCQSCGMPLSEGIYATEKDGSKNEDYCEYCYKDGEFTGEYSMEEMIEFCVPHMVENSEMNEEQARKAMLEFFPTLKRWKN